MKEKCCFNCLHLGYHEGTGDYGEEPDEKTCKEIYKGIKNIYMDDPAQGPTGIVPKNNFKCKYYTKKDE